MDFCLICPVWGSRVAKIRKTLEPYAARIRLQEGETKWAGV